MAILQKNNLYLKTEKCEFERERVEYLGMVVNEGKVEMDAVKVEGVSNWPTPRMKKELQQFLGFVNFYWWFIRDFASIAKPLHALTGKKLWTWDSEHATSFQKLKEAVTTSLVLTFPTDDDRFWVEADSSDFESGAVLSQSQHGV